MKKRSVVNAYLDVRPDEAAKERMLQAILEHSSEIPPAGKDGTMNRKKMKPLVLVASIVLMALLMGCAIVALSLEELKIGHRVTPGDTYVDESGTLVAEPNIEREVISLQGYHNSPGMLAAKEWFEFEESYDPDWTLLDESERNGFVVPEEYDAYSCYTQEMIDKVEEIAEKYGLKLAGAFADIQKDNNELFFDALGLDALHQTDVNAKAEYLSGYFYGCGNFDFCFNLTLVGENTWPDDILVSMRYNDKEYLDVIWASVSDIDKMEQWTYRTPDGKDVLIVLGDDQARIFCDRIDAFLSVSFFTNRWDENGENLYMSKTDVEQIVDCIDFSVKPQKPDMDHVKEKIAEYEAKQKEKLDNLPVVADEEQYRGFIRGRLAALEHPENLYYTKVDANGDGTVDLLLGTKDQLEVIWTVMDDPNDGTRHLTFIVPPEDVMEAMNRSWPNMEIYPITEYPLE